MSSLGQQQRAEIDHRMKEMIVSRPDLRDANATFNRKISVLMYKYVRTYVATT